MQEINWEEHFINNADVAINKGLELASQDSLDVIIYEGSRDLLDIAKSKGYSWDSAGGYPFLHPESGVMVNYIHLVFYNPMIGGYSEFAIAVNWTD
jgi:hypothetical protein